MLLHKTVALATNNQGGAGRAHALQNFRIPVGVLQLTFCQCMSPAVLPSIHPPTHPPIHPHSPPALRVSAAVTPARARSPASERTGSDASPRQTVQNHPPLLLLPLLLLLLPPCPPLLPLLLLHCPHLTHCLVEHHQLQQLQLLLQWQWLC